MVRLLSDVDGKIKHILLNLQGPADARRIGHIVKGFDKNAEVTVVYHGNSSESLPSHLLVKTKKVLRKELSALETLVSELPGGRRVNLLAIGNTPWIWVQDLVHVQEGGFILPSRPLTKKVISEQEGLAQRTVIELMNSHFWEQHRFHVDPREPILNNSDGGDLIAFGERLYVGNCLVGNYLRHQMGVNLYHGIRKGSYSKARNAVLGHLSRFDSERKSRLVGMERQPLEAHLDLVFTPISEDCVIVADIRSTLQKLVLPREIMPVPEQSRLADQLEFLAEKLAKDYEKVVRIPCIPRLYAPRGYNGEPVYSAIGDGSNTIFWPFVLDFISFNNVIQERFRDGDKVVHRIYMPLYPKVEAYGVPFDTSRVFNLQIEAVKVYMALGCEVRPVPFSVLAGYDGALRCSVKVLERTKV